MTVYVVAAVACILLAILLAVLNRFSTRLTSVEDERDHILGEEQRMFDFLHHLGSVIEKDISPVLLYKEIVEGLCEVLNATGGSMYILNHDGKNLIPSRGGREHRGDAEPLGSMGRRQWKCSSTAGWAWTSPVANA